MPGFVDIHNHGGGGASFSTGEQRAVEIAAGFHRRHGTTTVLASLVSGPIDDLADSIVAIRGSLARGMVAGVHLEGPFLNRVRCGAHDPAHLRDPTLPDVERLLAAAEGAVRMITLAPELDGAIDAVRLVAAAGVTAAIGHTDCTYEVARAAIDAGATVATHLYNAMPPTKARHPGPVLACLEDDRVCVELIADGVHLHSATLAHAAAVAGAGRTALVSDCTPLAGACGQASRLGTVAVEVRGVSAFVAGSQTLAGSLLTLD
ncbi:MAG: N-acetylglucosamine-6-phosphate deacetylase, partial [Streptosporangiaceae bacterium]